MNESKDLLEFINVPKQRTHSIKSTEVNKQNHKIKKNVTKKPSENNFLSYRSYEKKQEQVKHKQNLAINLLGKYKIAYEDLRNRLHVRNESDGVHDMDDVDFDFFKCISGRPFYKYAIPFKSLGHLFNNQLRFKQKIAYIKDSILNIEENHRKEENIYEVGVKLYSQQSRNFENFISDDYRKSMKLLAECDKLVNEVNKKIAELQGLAIKKFTITSRLIGLNYMYGHQQKYGRFLYYLSPPLWRLKNREFARSVEIEAKGFDYGTFSEEDTFNVIFENMKKECASGLIKPALYFKCPGELLKTFDGIEKQQLYHFIHVVNMAPHTNSLKDKITALKEAIAQDTAGIANDIKSFNNILEFHEELCSGLKEKFFKLIYGSFLENIATFDVLKLQVHLEFCYEKLYLDKPINLDVISMARTIELFDIEYNKKLEALHSDKVKTAVLKNLQTERKKMRMAKEAARELKLFGRLERALQRSFEPITGNQIQKLPAVKSPSKRKKIKRVHSQVPVGKQSSQVLTDAELEYLRLFTDWTENEDPGIYLQILSLS